MADFKASTDADKSSRSSESTKTDKVDTKKPATREPSAPRKLGEGGNAERIRQNANGTAKQDRDSNFSGGKFIR